MIPTPETHQIFIDTYQLYINSTHCKLLFKVEVILYKCIMVLYAYHVCIKMICCVFIFLAGLQGLEILGLILCLSLVESLHNERIQVYNDQVIQHRN